MLSLYKQLTVGGPLVRNYPISNNPQSRKPIWFNIKPRSGMNVELELLQNEKSRLISLQLNRHHQMELKSIIYNEPINSRCLIYNRSPYYKIYYNFQSPWKPIICKIYQNSLSGSIRYHENIGLKNLMNIYSESRIIRFGLSKALLYSYARDIRFSLVICGMLGFGIWWAMAPDLILFNTTDVLTSPNPGIILKVYRDTFIYHICSTHTDMISPCDCGEPLNKELLHILDKPSFDPLGSISRVKGAAVFVGSIILCLALAESCSTSGVYLNI